MEKIPVHQIHFDPLGLIIPFTVKGKLLMRDVNSRRLPDRPVSWDEPIDEEQRNQWLKYLSDMAFLEQIRFRRCGKPPDAFDQPTLIIFTDASSQAYGACAYVHWMIQSGGKACLISAKNRITPNR